MRAFLDRIWANLDGDSLEQKQPTDDPETIVLAAPDHQGRHRADIKRFSYNTALARMMELLNHINRANVRNQVVYETLCQLLSPFAPHLTEEIWERLGHKESIFKQPWPTYVEEHTQRATVEYVVQISGKVRAKMEIEVGLSEEEIEALVMADPKVEKWLEGKKIVKKIFVPDKLVNLVVK